VPRVVTQPLASLQTRAHQPAFEAALAAALALAVFVVRPAHRVLNQPYWFDEQWVALAAKVPIADLPRVSWTSPIGGTLMVHLFGTPLGAHLRVVTMLVAAGCVAVAYCIGRELDLVPVVGGLVTGGAILFAPIFAAFMELKPYVGDAFITLALLLALARLETRWTARRLIGISAIGALGPLFSHPAVFSTAAVTASLLVVTIAQRQWRRARDTALAAASSLAVAAMVFLAFDRRHQNHTLNAYWHSYFMPTSGGLTHIRKWLRFRASLTLPFTGSRSTLLVFVALAAGVATLVARRRYALALAMPMLAAIAMIASAAKRYPLLDARTNLYLLATVVLFMAIGLLGIVRLLARVHGAVGAIALVLISALWLREVQPAIGKAPIPRESLRQEVAYYEGHRQPNDLVVMSFASMWGFALYQTSAPFSIEHVPGPVVGFPDYAPVFRDPAVMVAPDRRPPSVGATLLAAEQRARELGSSRVWVVISHATVPESKAWRACLAPTHAELKYGSPRAPFQNSLLLVDLGPATRGAAAIGDSTGGVECATGLASRP
jgi:hypothetical protein